MPKRRVRAKRGQGKSYFEKKYGITQAQRDVILHYQNGACAVCGGDNGGRTLNVDHNHKTKEVRGLLCFRCNKYVIGRWQDGKILRAAADYLDDPPARRALKS